MGDGVHQKVLEQDPILYGTKKMFSEIAGNADTENMLAEYNAGFKQDMRRFLKSDEGMISGAEFHVRRNTGSFGTINYMANQDGFTLYDTVAYNIAITKRMARTTVMAVNLIIPGTVALREQHANRQFAKCVSSR